MKLELKFISPYYIHGLECQLFWTKEDGILEFERIGKLIELKEKTKDQHPLVFKCKLSEDSKLHIDLAYDFSEVKPILLPLSALTEPLEDGSIPAIKLAELLIEKGIKKDIAPTIPFSARIVTKPFGKMLKVTKCDEWYVMISFDNPERGQHILIEKLIEWHFDIYGLIDAGLAIDKRTIKL